MPPGETEVDLAALTTVSTDLTREGLQLHDQAARLDLAPDCGRTSDETARGVGGLAAAVAGVAEHLGAFASTLDATIADYRASDERSTELFNTTGGPP
jgi:hypothetical protein